MNGIVTSVSLGSSFVYYPLVFLLDDEKRGPVSEEESRDYKIPKEDSEKQEFESETLTSEGQEDDLSFKSNDNFLVVDRKISGVDFKLCGVQHDRECAQMNFDALETLVMNSSVTVMESGHGTRYGIPYSHGNHALGSSPFFSTVAQFCKKYNKPVIDLDSVNGAAHSLELLLGAGGAGYSWYQSVKLKYLNESDDGLDRRTLLSSGAKILGGTYLALSGLFSGMLPKGLFYGLVYGKNSTEKRCKHDTFFFSHVADQRNVEITKRSIELPKLLSNKDLNNGDYILSVFGAAHVFGMDYYLKHPVHMKIKSAMYSYSYDLLDFDGIVKYTHKNGFWNKEVLKN